MHDAFLHKVRESSSVAKDFGRSAAILHVCSLANVDEEVAGGFYEGVKKELGKNKVVAMNLHPEALIEFISTGKLVQVRSDRREQIERAAGATGPVTFAFLSKTRKGNMDQAPCSVVLSGIENEAVVVSGDSGRLRNPSRLDYAPNPSEVLYDWEHADEAMASSAILALGPHELSGGLSQAMEHIRDDYKIYGPCHVMLTGKISPENIKSIVVPDEKMVSEVRAALNAVKRLLPVEADGSRVFLRMPYLEREEKDSPPERDYEPMWISIGEEVALKPTASNPRALGKIIDIANGKVSVQWDDGDRTIFDLQEALVRLMPAPEGFEMPKGAEVYSLAGLAKEHASMLFSLGMDAVDLHSTVFANTPPIGSNVQEDAFKKAMEDLGVDGEFVDGFAEGEDAIYAPKRWFEASLPYGNRLVIDAFGGKPKIMAGSVPEYILLPAFTDVPIE